MNDNNNLVLLQALYLAELGYKVFPCVPNGKQPVTANGLKDASGDEFQLYSWFQDNPTYNLAVITDGLLIVDRDVDKETGKQNPWLQGDPRLLDLMAGPVAATPRGGDHSWFRQPAGADYRNTVNKLAPQVDTRGNGGYVLVYPSTVDGKSYEWLPTNPLDCSPDRLPTPPEWLLDLLNERKPTIKSEDPQEQGACEGGRNAYLTRTGGGLRRIGLSESEILSALLTRNAERCTPPLGEDEVRKIAKSVARYEEDQIATLIVEGTEPEPKTDNPGKFPQQLLNVPGFLHKVMDFNLRGAIRPQPELALAGSLALLGTLTGRKIAGETRLRTNLYIVGLCDTGGGKDRGLQTNKQLLMAAGLPQYIPFEDLASAAGLVNVMKTQQTLLLQIDEIGKFLKATKDAAGNPHLAEVVTILMKFFSCANSYYAGKGYANVDQKSQIINPHVCLYGVSVPQSVMESISLENLTDGFLSRLMIFEASDNSPEAIRYPKFDDPSEDLVEEVKWWDSYNPAGGNLASLNTPQPRVVRDGPGVNDLFYQAEEWYRKQREHGEAGAALWTRAAEKARKLALLHQLSSDRESHEVSIESATWALEVVLHLTQRMIFVSKDWVADSRLGADKNKIIRVLRERGELTITQLCRSMQHLKAKDVRELLSDLELSGRTTTKTTTIQGQSRVVYLLA